MEKQHKIHCNLFLKEKITMLSTKTFAEYLFMNKNIGITNINMEPTATLTIQLQEKHLNSFTVQPSRTSHIVHNYYSQCETFAFLSAASESPPR